MNENPTNTIHLTEQLAQLTYDRLCLIVLCRWESGQLDELTDELQTMMDHAGELVARAELEGWSMDR